MGYRLYVKAGSILCAICFGAASCRSTDSRADRSASSGVVSATSGGALAPYGFNIEVGSSVGPDANLIHFPCQRVLGAWINADYGTGSPMKIWEIEHKSVRPHAAASVPEQLASLRVGMVPDGFEETVRLLDQESDAKQDVSLSVYVISETGIGQGRLGTYPQISSTNTQEVVGECPETR